MNDPTKCIHLPEPLSTVLARRIIAGPVVPAVSTLYGRAAMYVSAIDGAI